MTTNQINMVFARVGDRGFMVGVSLEEIAKHTKLIYPELLTEQITPINEQLIPREYNWSVRRVKEFRDWEKTGAYLLIKNFEKYRDSFRRYFPDVEVEGRVK
ncbi:hypothetical protein HY450_03415 [Candidatus Pacearchaeota archaeon]|nr:hypothetical protein [Candidatus Pacearchaeota archaeon]